MPQSLSTHKSRRGRVFPEYNLPPSELASRQAEIDTFGQRCQVVWEKVCPALIKDHYNWFITFEPESGDYFIDPDERAAYQKARTKYPQAKLGTFRLNETGACGKI